MILRLAPSGSELWQQNVYSWCLHLLVLISSWLHYVYEFTTYLLQLRNLRMIFFFFQRTRQQKLNSLTGRWFIGLLWTTEYVKEQNKMYWILLHNLPMSDCKYIYFHNYSLYSIKLDCEAKCIQEQKTLNTYCIGITIYNNESRTPSKKNTSALSPPSG